MIRNRLYYGIKPVLPLSLRLRIRRWFAERKRATVSAEWPILPGSEKKPEGWPGWPDGKQFAVVLTHDVEGQSGVNKCRAMMELEKKYGFRSSFNFIPRGEYQDPVELRRELTSNGFEVGVHDLYHNGKLYRSRSEFRRHALEINKYVKAWGAAGFRSGFMLHNLDWIHELDVQYDASTFDTDPFEPQPEGQRTIFPFWVERPHRENGGRETERRRAGYVELPYSLPQDSTLFYLLRERHPDIWFQKLDWIARHGGMVLVNVHPDYMRFAGGEAGIRTYPSEMYERFLEYVRCKYGGSYWQATCAQVATFVTQAGLPPRRKPLRVCMVTHSDYVRDARVTRYAEALANRGDEVNVLALQPAPGVPKQEKVGDVHLTRLQRRYAKDGNSQFSYVLPVLRFLAASTLWIAREHAKRRFDLLHIHNIPDFLVFAGVLPKLRGAKVILDIHDIVPEFYASKFSISEGSVGIRLLKMMEVISSKVADHVIIANDLWVEKYRSRTGANGKCSVFINNVDTGIFFPRRRTRADGKFIILFPGGLQWHQGIDIAIHAFKTVHREIPNAEFHIYGDGNMKPKLMELAAELGLQDAVRFFDPLPVRQIAEVMANADLGVVPKRADGFGNEAYSTKIMEFMSLGVPLVVSRTRIDEHYFNESLVRFFDSGDSEAMAHAMVEVLKSAQIRAEMVRRAFEYSSHNSWETRKRDYLELVDSLRAPQRVGAPSAGRTVQG